MSEALRQVVWKCDRCGGDAQAIFGIFPSCKCGSTSFKAAQPPAPTAQPAKACEWTNCPTRVGDVCCFDRLDRIAKGAAQPVQQPGVDTAKKLVNEFGRACAFGNDETRVRAGDALLAALLAAPAQRQPLTQDEILDMAEGVSLQFHDLLEFARAIEAAHGITAAPAAQKGEKP